MGTLDDVLAEEWVLDEFGEIMAKTEEGETAPRLDIMQDGRTGQLVGNAVILGKRALALVLKQEWTGREEDRHVSDGDGYFDTMPGETCCCHECGMNQRDGGKHLSGCEWGAICDEARRLRDV